MKSRWGAVAWVAGYVLVAVAPLLLSLIQLDPGRGFWVNLSVSFGFAGLALLGLQFVLAARSLRVAQPTGVLPLLQFHREISYLVLVLILAHPIILVLYDSSFWSLLDMVHAPLRAQLAIVSVLALLLLVATSVWRTRVRLSYHAWQVLHASPAVLIVATALAHVLLIGYYVDQPWERALWVVYSLAFVWISLWVRVVKPPQRWRRRWRVAEVREQPGDSLTIGRINTLLEDSARNGNEGIGKPEPLRHGFQGYWSRRITSEHRLVYRIIDEQIRIAACRYHYAG